MMMTCRLLCALLVLALCCCPAVCGTKPTEVTIAVPEAEAPGKGPSSQSLPSEEVKVKDQPGSLSKEPRVELGIEVPGSLTLTAPDLQSKDISNTLEASGMSGKAGTQSNRNTSLNKGKQKTENTVQRSTTQPLIAKREGGPDVNNASPSSLPPEGIQGISYSGPQSTGFAVEKGGVDGDEPRLTDKEPEEKGTTNTLQAEGNNGTRAQQSHTSPSAVQSEQNAEHPADTTNTKKTPTTTTTTTAPEAPSTTSTESPTVSTTHAPSRLREIDGSLSSSAWVCAPLVLAASALACTALG
ncbi:mucin TcMUCII, putative [Trypanosoma cruzi marinkellei]|uniref:Mucin TcMUCII, putative n=1 Tax=Trypanosoma cruzi marinkellei TaxID=85056 RepID=K2MYP6_TRYCR|nr:mucin TcMUCII, putative [Trypanosoma cruzi marinkellei]